MLAYKPEIYNLITDKMLRDVPSRFFKESESMRERERGCIIPYVRASIPYIIAQDAIVELLCSESSASP